MIYVKYLLIASMGLTACQSADHDSKVLSGGNSVNNGVPGRPIPINCRAVPGVAARVTITGSLTPYISRDTHASGTSGGLRVAIAGIRPAFNQTIAVRGDFDSSESSTQVISGDFVPTSAQAVSLIHIDLSTADASSVTVGGKTYPTDCSIASEGGTPAPTANVSIKLEPLTAGVDYPTDVPRPANLAGKQVLVIDTKRILVDASATLGQSEIAGTILIIDASSRIAIHIEAAQAGIDFPTDRPVPANAFVWVFNTAAGDRRVALDTIQQVIKAQAGVDYPTDGPADLERDFAVAVTSSERIVLR